MNWRIYLYFSCFGLLACGSKEGTSFSQSLKMQTYADTLRPVVYWLVINAKKVRDIQDRKNIAACIDYSPYKQPWRIRNKNAVFLHSLFPPVYKSYKSTPFTIGTAIVKRNYKKSVEEWTFLLQNSGTIDCPHEFTLASLKKKLDLGITSNFMLLDDFLQRVKDGDYALTVCTGSSESLDDPGEMLEDMMFLNIPDTTNVYFRNEYSLYKSAKTKKQKLKALARIEYKLQEEYCIIPLYYIMD